MNLLIIFMKRLRKRIIHKIDLNEKINENH